MCFENFINSFVTCIASSLVGTSTRACTDLLLLFLIFVSRGSAKAAVLPVPVWACPITSLPCMISGIAASCIGKGLSNLFSASAFRTLSSSPSSLNVIAVCADSSTAILYFHYFSYKSCGHSLCDKPAEVSVPAASGSRSDINRGHPPAPKHLGNLFKRCQEFITREMAKASRPAVKTLTINKSRDIIVDRLLKRCEEGVHTKCTGWAVLKKEISPIDANYFLKCTCACHHKKEQPHAKKQRPKKSMMKKIKRIAKKKAKRKQKLVKRNKKKSRKTRKR